MLLAFKLAVTLLIIGLVWLLILRFVDEFHHSGYLDLVYYGPPALCVVFSIVVFIVLLLIKVWRY